MPLQQLGSLCNILGLVIPLIFSLSIARTYHRPYFFSWTQCYFFLAAAVGLYAYADGVGLPLWLTFPAVLLYTAGSWSLLDTAERLPGAKPLSRFHRYLTVGSLVVAIAMMLIGLPVMMALTAPVLVLVWAHLVVGGRLMAMQSPTGRRTPQWLGFWVCVTGLWVLAFPALGKTSYSWAGFVFSGCLHMLIGIEMVLFVLEDAANMLKVQNAQLQELDRLKSNFLSTITHELRTPLNSIKSAAWLLSKRPPNIDEAEMLDIINNQAETLHKLVTDVLDISKMEAGTLSYRTGEVVLEPLIMSVSQNMAPSFQEKGLTLDHELEPLPRPLRADADRLSQVLTNLLTNALKFTPKGGRVTIRTRLDGDQARIEVSDTGIGIPTELREKVFDRFYQVDNSSTRKVGGAGLGLSISKAIVEEGHGGRIWVEASPEGGSKFVLTLPLAPVSVPA